MSLVDSIAQSIATMEGFYNPGSIPQRNNNPGDLRSWGSNPVVSGYVKFPSLQAGWDALKQQIQLNINRGLTLQEFFAGKPGVYAGYSPSSDGNRPAEYAQYVASQAGISPNVPLNQIGAGPVYPSDVVFTATGTAAPDPFGGDSDTSTLSFQAGNLSDGGLSSGALIALLLGGLALYFAFRD